MNILSFFSRRRSAPVARERLQVLLAHERAVGGASDLVSVLREEILAVIARHVPVSPENLRVRTERRDQVTTLEVEVDFPSATRLRVALAG